MTELLWLSFIPYKMGLIIVLTSSVVLKTKLVSICKVLGIVPGTR